MAIIQVEHPVIDESSFEPQNRQDGISGAMLIHNEEEFLAQVIDTWIDAIDELVIVFNDCTDNSPQIIEEYERKYYPKIRAFNYLQRVYSPNTKEQLELDVNNVNSFTFYANFNLSLTRYKTCVVINGDHVGIPEYLKYIYNLLKKNPLQNTALLFSGLNLWKNPDDSQYCINLNDIALGDGDLAYWTVSPNHIFVKNPNDPLFSIVRWHGLEYYYLGFIFWHTRFLKKDSGLGNYGTHSENLNQFFEDKFKEVELVPFSPEFKEKNKGFQYVSVEQFSLYFDFGSLPEVVGVDSVIELLQQGVQHYQANRFTQAEQAYRQVLDIQPEHPEALYRLGILTEQIGNPRKAEEFLSRALQVQPNSVKIWFSLANLRQSQGELSAAVDAYHQALELRPDSAPIYNNLGYAFYQQGEWDKAITCYKKALELKPQFIEADVNLGNALHAQGKLLPEQQAYYGMLNCQLGETRSQVGDWQTAIAYYRQAIVLQPDLTEAHNYLAVALRQSIPTELKPS